MTITVRQPSNESIGLSQSYTLRELAFKIAIQLASGSLKGKEHAQAKLTLDAIKAWETADERVRIHRNKPLPGTRSTKPEKQPKAERAIPAPVKSSNGQVKTEVEPAPGVTEADTPAEPLCVPKSSSKVKKATSEGKANE